MKISKKLREKIRQKYCGHCAYCGGVLSARWHIDHINPIVRDWIKGTCKYPEKHTIENMNPSCPSCNIMKGSMSLDSFRRLIGGFITSLNRDSTQYKFAKRYGLVQEVDREVKFFFETF